MVTTSNHKDKLLRNRCQIAALTSLYWTASRDGCSYERSLVTAQNCSILMPTVSIGETSAITLIEVDLKIECYTEGVSLHIPSP